MAKTFYITTPIYYTSGRLTIGHSYTTIICDVIKKYKENRGYDCFFLTGSDEHGQKVQEEAKKKGLTPKQYTDELVVKCKELWKLLKIDYDKFIRTTDDYHESTVQKIFSEYIKQEDVYKSSYEGWYCTPCESFWTETQVGEEHLCPDCNRPVHKETEESYFFKMSKYSDFLLKYYEEHNGFIEPISRQNEMVSNFIKPGLEDLCVSRTSFDWGVKVVEDPKHVVYVWIDALSNYITALGYKQDNHELFDKYWKNDEDHEILHVVGKEITRFHCIYWPIMLKALDLPLPTKIIGHGWVLMRGAKMSKSKGNVVYPEPLIERYGLDALRFFSACCVPFGSDGQFTPELYVDNINTSLVNNYGNLVSRTISMIDKYFDGIIPTNYGNFTNFDKELVEEMKNSKDRYEKLFDKYNISDAFKEVFDLLNKGNKYIDDTKPWELAKDENKKAELASVMNNLAMLIKEATILLSPVLVESAPKVYEAMGIKDTSYDHILDLNTIENNKVTKISPLFPRLDTKVEYEFIDSMMK